MKTIDKIVHHWLRLPYTLSVRHKRLKKVFGTTYVLIHGLADTGDLWKPLLDKLPKDANYFVVDLLGHGNSAHPDGDDIYSAQRQAHNLLKTYLKTGMSGPVVLIGHSFGGLVASEFARGYRGIVKQLILVSPPIYRDESQDKKDQLRQEKILRDVYRQFVKKPDLLMHGYGLVNKLRLMGFSKIKFNKENYIGIIGTLRSGIIDQQAGKRLARSTVPTTIIYGRLDPLLVPSNFTALKGQNSNINIVPLVTGHAMRDVTIKAILKVLL